MKKVSKLFVAAVASVALVGAFALVGCSGSTGSTSSSSSSSSSSSASHEKVELQIYAANSLSKALDEVQSLYKESHDWVSFADTQYKSSGELNEMLKAGGTADIEITASKATMDAAEQAGYIETSTRFDMFKNDLVMVTSESNSSITSCTLEDIAAGKYKVGVGDESVPAGNYACQSLSTVGCYTSADGATGKDATGKGGTFSGALAGEGMVAQQSSVGNVCKLAQSGDVDIAFVYTSDVYRFGGVKIVGTVPANTHKNIIYPAAVTSMAGDKATECSDFLKWATTDEDALKVWQKWGFELAA